MDGRRDRRGHVGPRLRDRAQMRIAIVSTRTASLPIAATSSARPPRAGAGEDAAIDHAEARCGSAFWAWPASSMVCRRSRARGADEFGASPQRLAGFRVLRVGGEAGQHRACRARHDPPERAQILAGEIVGHDREAILLDPEQRPRQIVDRIVVARPARMAAGIGDRQPVTGERLLGPLHQIASGRPSGPVMPPPASVLIA